jgi:hypothetical protein
VVYSRRIFSKSQEVIKLNQKTYLQVTGLMFTVGAVVHLLRLLMGWSATIAGWDVPVWLSLVAVVVAGYLAYSAYKLTK